MEKFFFYLFATTAIGGALSTVTRKNPLTGAISLIVTFVALSGLYFLLRAPFAGIVQILVYAGAIMVLMVFVIMFLNLPDSQMEEERISKPGLILSLFLLVPLSALSLAVVSTAAKDRPAPAEIDVLTFGTVESVGTLLFEKYTFQFEAVSILLLVAIVGSIVLAKKRLQ